MKKLFTIFTVTLMLVLGTASVQANETDTDTTDEEVKLEVGAGITPDSPLYFLDKGWEDFRLWLASSEEKEAELLLEYAEERLSELNELDEESLNEYADELYEEYGVKLETVNEIIAELVATEGLDAEKLSLLQEELGHAADVEGAVDVEKVSQVSEEVKEKIKDAQTKSYAVSVASGMEETVVNDLKEKGYGYGEILKLQAISQLSGKTIEEIMYLDIFEEDGEEKEIDFGKLATELGLDKDEIKDQFKAYNKAIRDVKKEAKDNDKGNKENKGEEKKAELEQKFNEKMTEVISKRQQELMDKINNIYNTRLTAINNADITDEQKQALITQLDEIKENLIAEIQAKVEEDELNPRDLGELNREIAQSFNEVLEDLGVTDEEKTQLREELGDLSAQVRPLIDEIINNYETENEVTLTNEDKALIVSEIMKKVNEIKDEEDAEDEFNELLSELEEKIMDLIEDDNNSNGNRRNGRN